MRTHGSLSRRGVLLGTSGAGLAALAVGTATSATAGTPGPAPAPTPPARAGGWPKLPPAASAALAGVLAGNERFRTGRATHPRQSPAYAAGLASGQHPSALVFCCVDSRVPAEILTDQGVGDLFTVRTAGHVPDRAVLGSIEFGVAELAIPLVIVLGHESCGAVKAAVAAVDAGEPGEGAVAYLVDALRPVITANAGITDPVRRIDATVRQYTRSTAARLVRQSDILTEAIEAGKLSVVAAHYDLDTLAVTPA